MNVRALLSAGTVAVVALGVVWALGDGGVRVGPFPASVWTSLVAIGINIAAFVPSYLAQRETFYDLVGAVTYLIVVVVGLASAADPGSRSLLVASMVALWAIRLGSFLFTRILADGTDRRFDRIKPDPARFLLAWMTQALWVVLTSATAVAVLTAAPDSSIDAAAPIGLGIWTVGFGIEVVADEQKRRFRNAGRPGGFIRSGLWARSRHPNYLGEIVLWCGVAVVAIPTLEGWRWIALVSPLFVTVLLTRVSGIPMLERSADRRWGDDPDYRTYKASTPVLLPTLSSGRPTAGAG